MSDLKPDVKIYQFELAIKGSNSWQRILVQGSYMPLTAKEIKRQLVSNSKKRSYGLY